MLAVILFLFGLAAVCYSIVTFHCLKGRCPNCEKPARCDVSWGVMLSRPFASSCIHCGTKLP